MTDLIDTTEMYLRTVLELEEEGIVPMRARIAERLGHSGPTVSQTVARMERDGLVLLAGDRHLELTDAGRAKATRVMRKHRLAERLLMDVIGLEWEYVHEEACRWEHVMSEQVERKLLDLLADPSESPYGNPIPGLAEIGGPVTTPFLTGVVPLPEALPDDPMEVDPAAPSGGEVQVTVRRLGEPLQSDVDLLSRLVGSGIGPARPARARRLGQEVEVRGDGDPVRLSLTAAGHVFVQLEESGVR